MGRRESLSQLMKSRKRLKESITLQDWMGAPKRSNWSRPVNGERKPMTEKPTEVRSKAMELQMGLQRIPRVRILLMLSISCAVIEEILGKMKGIREISKNFEDFTVFSVRYSLFLHVDATRCIRRVCTAISSSLLSIGLAKMFRNCPWKGKSFEKPVFSWFFCFF